MDVAAIEQELQKLQQEREQASQKLNAFRQPFRAALGIGPSRDAHGNGTGPVPFRQRMGETAGRGPEDRHFGSAPGPRNMGRAPYEGAAPARMEGRLSRPQVFGPGPSDRDGPYMGPRARGAPQPGRPAEGSVFSRLGRTMSDGPAPGPGGRAPFNIRDGRMAPQDPPADARPKRILSAVVAPEPSGEDTDPASGAKRTAAAAALLADDGSKKRARNLFGRALVGTLQKFRQEDEAFRASEVAAKREEAQRRAEERERQEHERLRKLAAEKRAAERQQEIDHLHEINLATDIKTLELLYAKRISRKDTLHKFMVTKAHPPLFWMPKEHTEETEESHFEQLQDLEKWKQGILAELEKEKSALRERAAARKKIAEERRAATRATAGGKADQEHADEEEENNAMQGGEYENGQHADEDQQDRGRPEGQQPANKEDTAMAEANQAEEGSPQQGSEDGEVPPSPSPEPEPEPEPESEPEASSGDQDVPDSEEEEQDVHEGKEQPESVEDLLS